MIFMLSSETLAKKKKRRLMSRKWHRINRLVNQEIKTINKLSKKLGPRLRYRIIELYSEKIKLLREKENKIFLSSTKKTRRKKSSYFIESQKLYKKLISSGYKSIKKFPRFKYNAEIYYTMAINARDYGGSKTSEKLLYLSLEYAKAGSPTTHQAKTSLAEHYYNSKRYKKAIRFYKDVIRNKHDEWYSKHLFNYSWCLFKTGKLNTAVASLEKSYFVGKSKKYLDNETQVLDSLPIFYVYAGKINKGINFITRNTKKPVDYLLKMAQQTSKRGEYNNTKKIFSQGLKISKRKRKYNQEFSIRNEQLLFYRTFKKSSEFYNTARQVQILYKKRKPSKENLASSIQIIKEYVGVLQIYVTKNSKINVRNVDEATLRKIIAYFNILISIDRASTGEYHFYQGESLFSVRQFSRAADYYTKAILVSKNLKKNKWVKKSLLSLLSLLDKSNFKGKLKFKHTEFTYKKYTTLWPRGKKSRVIYTRLFNLYFNTGRLASALKTLKTYSKAFPKDRKNHQAQLVLIINRSIKDKNTVILAKWVKKLQSGYLGFAPKYIKNATTILSQLLFEKLQNSMKGKNKREIIKGYLALYEDEQYPRNIKAKSAINMATLYLDLRNINETINWMKKSIALFKNNELIRFSAKYDAIIVQLSLLQETLKASKVGLTFFNRLCSSTYAEKTQLYQKIVQFNIIENNYLGVSRLLKKGNQCRISKKIIAQSEMAYVNAMIINNKWSLYFSFANMHIRSPRYKSILVQYALKNYWENYTRPQTKLKFQNILNLYARSNNDKTTKKINQIMQFPILAESLKSVKFMPFDNVNKFNENLFTANLEKNFQILKSLTDKSSNITKQGNPNIIIMTNKILAKKYLEISNLINGIKVIGMPADYVEGLKSDMNQYVVKLKEKAYNYLSTTISQINNEGVLSHKTIVLYDDINSNLHKSLDLKFQSSHLIYTHDFNKGGK